MKTKTQDLTGPALDWAVFTLTRKDRFTWYLDHEGRFMQEHGEASSQFSPSTLWQDGGPIIEREKIKLSPNIGRTWSSQIRHETDHPLVAHRVLAGWTNKHGPTPLIAAMRCYVASKLGDTIDIPEELA